MGGYCGGTSAEDLLRLRRMVAEPSDTTYTDAMLVATVERYPVPAASAFGPDEAAWPALYDLAMAASAVWEEKSAALAANFDFDADGATFQRSQQYEHALKQARRWRSLRVPGNYTVVTIAPVSGDEWPSVAAGGSLNFSEASASGLLAVI